MIPFAVFDNAAVLIGLIVVGALIYFFPAFVAGVRNHPNSTSIFILDLFLGWSLVGWVVALVWAFAAFPPQSTSEPEYICPNCETPIASLRVRTCPGCGMRFRP